MLVHELTLASVRLGSTATDWMPFSSAFIVCGGLAACARFWVPELNLVLVILSAIAIILPGYTISLGAEELMAQESASGAANLRSDGDAK